MLIPITSESPPQVRYEKILTEKISELWNKSLNNDVSDCGGYMKNAY